MVDKEDLDGDKVMVISTNLLYGVACIFFGGVAFYLYQELKNGE
jgi:hypothetical protein